LFGILCFLVLATAAAVLIPWRADAGAQSTAARSKPPKSKPDDQQEGKQVLQAHACGTCHGSEGQGMTQGDLAAPRIGPNRLSLALFVRFVRSPAGQMPAYTSQDVSDKDLEDLYGYLQSLAQPLPAEILSAANAQSGQKLYVQYGCYECHSGQGQGSTQTGGSRIAPVQIPFPVFVQYVRQPTAQMPPYAVKAISNGELADIYAFLKSRPESAGAKTIPLLSQ
jgi:mono/diheme cytochrome c family protein